MARKKDEEKGFRLLNSYQAHFEKMTDADAGKVIKAIFSYVNDGEVPELCGAAEIAFSFIENQLSRDLAEYESKCRRNRENGAKGGRPKQAEKVAEDVGEMETHENPEKPNGYFGLSERGEIPDDKEAVAPQAEPQTASEKPKKKTKPLRKDYPEGFERFWKAYPRNVDKGLAYDKYAARIKDGFSPEELEAAAIRYRQQCELMHTEPKYIKHAKTFLGPSGAFMEYLPKKQEAPKAVTDGYDEVDFNSYIKGGADGHD